MKIDRKTKAVSLQEKTIKSVQEIANSSFGGNFSLAVDELLKDALAGRKSYQEEHNLNRFVLMKMFFYLRENFRAREDGLLEKMDANFLRSVEEMKRALLEEGVDYGPF